MTLALSYVQSDNTKAEVFVTHVLETSFPYVLFQLFLAGPSLN